MSKRALVTFRPLDPYFFGGELTHGSGEAANYFSKSNPLPQQTTLCGMLRHLLFQNNCNRGLHSFNPNDPKLNDYGDLLNLSPLFLTNGKGFFLRQAIDRHEGSDQMFELLGEKPDEWMLLDSGELPEEEDDKVQLPTWQNARRWKNFEPKKDLANTWVSPDQASVDPNDIFKMLTRPGIPKKELRRPKANGPGLFKQQLYRFTPGWAFCVLAEFSEEIEPNDLHNETLPMGAEKTVFHISVQSEKRLFEEIFPPEKMFYADKKPHEPRLVLTSDAWVTEDVWQYAIAAVTETTDFRHISTHSSVKHFGRLHQWTPNSPDASEQMTKSSKYTLLRRGTVLITDVQNLQNLQNALSIEPWKTIGFNHFFTYP